MTDMTITGHTLHRYDEELLAIHGNLLAMGNKVSAQLKNALLALHGRNLEIARAVIAGDQAVDAIEMKIDEDIVKIIAKRAPVARDLRLLMAISKAVTDIERIGDKAVKIAGRTLKIYSGEAARSLDPLLLQGIHTTGQLGIAVFDNVLDAFATFSMSKACMVLDEKVRMDNEFRESLSRLISLVTENADHHGDSLNVVFIIKSLDRVVDHSENIAEHLIYLLKGEDIRHSCRHNRSDPSGGPL
ncbi:MAG: phosphate signaling complex protein PhoU [Thermodesulfobacteriota bacterium]